MIDKTDATRLTNSQVADAAGEWLGQVLDQMHRETGAPMELLLIGAHAQIVAMMAMSIGGPMAAACCERAVKRVRDLPSQAAMSLAMAPVAGRA